MEQTQVQIVPQATLFQLLSGQIVSRSIGLVADLGIADFLVEGPRDINALATATKSKAGALYRVMRLLTGFGIFSELPGQKFGNNTISEFLRSDKQGSVKDFARWFVDPIRWQALGNLDYSVRTGNSAMVKGQEEKTVFEVFQEFPASVDTFNQAMTSISEGEGQAVIHSYDFKPYRKIIDVGGGMGYLAVLIAKSAPDSKVTVFDWPSVIENAKIIIPKSGLNGRVVAEGGNYLNFVPGPADLFVMKNIIHGEADENALKLLKNCRKAINKNGRILVIESVISNGPESIGARIMDIEMLFGPGGRQRTKEEHKKLFEKAGFNLEKLIHIEAGPALIEGRAIES